MWIYFGGFCDGLKDATCARRLFLIFTRLLDVATDTGDGRWWGL